MNVLFFMRSTVYVRNFESTLRRLAQRGHRVHVVADRHLQLDQADLIGRLCRDYPGITHGEPPPPLRTRWSAIGHEIRRGLDYLRYLGPEYEDAPKLRQRAELKAPVLLTRATRLTAGAGRRRVLMAALRIADRVVPVDPKIVAFIRERRPDLVLVTPLVEPGSPQSSYVRAAQALGVRTGLCVYSWDNLTNKGLIHDDLDLVTVWNPPMRDEALTLHRMPPDRVTVTGAPAYDHWFGWTPTLDREAFCARVGLDPARPFLLYLCSSRFIAPQELPFVERWIAEIRGASPVLRDAGILIRPHPQNAGPWREADLSRFPNVAVWPRGGGNPVDAETRGDYYDSIVHSAAVVGINTSAQIESAIVGRPVHTVMAPEFRDTQEGTLHFRHLREVNGGLLHVAPDMAGHVAQLEESLRDPAAAAARCERFVSVFVRPFGLDTPATPRLVATLEAVAARGRRPRRRAPWYATVVRPMVFRVARVSQRLEEARRQPGKRTRADRHERVERPTVEKPRAAAARLAGEAWQHYQDLRASCAAMRDAEPAIERTPAEMALLAALEPLWQADAETIADLRSCAKALTGLRRSNYREARADEVGARLSREVRRLFDKGDADLWLPESPVLGGVGLTLPDVGFANEDTVEAFRIRALLREAGVLRFFQSGERRTLWDIGGGWGGFADQFRQTCPNTTVLVTGAPVQLLAVATYLRTRYPWATFRMFDPSRPAAFTTDWHQVDFAFAPESVAGTLTPPGLALLTDLRSLERLTPARATAVVERAHALGAQYLFSVTAADPDTGPTAGAIQAAAEQAFWLHGLSAPAYLDRRFGVRDGQSWWLGWRRCP